ncbi:MAG: phosphate starvation-inducible protein PhoH [Rhodospirillaceae bacterium]|nr:MAG: phosphate starvation-inducible protein PhoH [Rhodospirillaceae bacterium]
MSKKNKAKAQKYSAVLAFDDNTLAQSLFGAHSAHLVQVEQALDVVIIARGAELTISSNDAQALDRASRVLEGLYDRLEQGANVETQEVAAALRMIDKPGGSAKNLNMEVRTKKRVISPRSSNQAAYLNAIDKSELVFGIGPAGTGKTYLAVAKAVERLICGDVDRIILTRPAVEAGEQLGFLPGDLKEKIDPYLRPLYDALHDMMPDEQVARRLESGTIEVAPLAFMRGRTLANAFVILDEAQNTTAVQMKMFLTRLGENSRMVVTGDLTQVDLPRGIRSGLRDARGILQNTKGIEFIEFDATDVVRHPIVTRIVTAYDKVEKQRKRSAPYEDDDA